MKINIFTYVFWPEQFLINELSEDFVKKGHVCHVMTGLPNYPKGEFFDGYSIQKGPYTQEHKGLSVRRYPVTPRKKGFFWLMINYLSHFVGGLFTQYYLPKADWAFVFATSPITTAIPAILWAKLNKAKVCIWLQDLWPDSVAAVGATQRSSLFYNVLGFLVRWIYSQTDLILIQSPGFVENLKEFHYKGPYYVVPNWAPDLDFEKVQKPEWLTKSNQKFSVTFAGNVGKAQAIETVVQAARILEDSPNIEFLIVGDGSELEAMKKMSPQNVHFFGRRPLSDMPGLFKESDALLVSLKNDPIFAKTIPSKVQAYMAAGKPLIGSLDGVGAEVIRIARCGFSAPAERAQELAEAVRQMAQTSAEKRHEMGRNAHSYFYENYRKDRIIGQILNYLEQHR